MKFQIYGIGDNGVKVKLLSFTVDVGDKSADDCAYILRSQIRQHLIKRLTPQPEIVRILHGRLREELAE